MYRPPSSVAIFLQHANTQTDTKLLASWKLQPLSVAYLGYPAIDKVVSQVPDEGVLLAQHLRGLQDVTVLLAGLEHPQLPEVHLH